MLPQNTTTSNTFTSFSLKVSQKQKSQINEAFADYFPQRQRSKAIIMSFFDRSHFEKGCHKFLELTYKMIASGCRLSESTIERHIPQLIEEGWLISSISKNGLFNRYKLNVEKIQNEIGAFIGINTPPSVEENPPQLRAHINTPTEKNINQEQKVIENRFSFNKRVIPKPILKNKKQKQQQDLLVGQQEKNKNICQNTKLVNKNLHSAPPCDDLYKHIELDDEGWCIDTQTENFNQQFEPEQVYIPTENELVVREDDRQEYLDRVENCGVQLDAWLKRYCLTVSLDKLENAINTLEQQTSNKNQARAKAKGRGETDTETSPRYQIKNPTNFLISALDKEWKPNTKSESYTSNGSHREVNADTLRPEITPAYIKSKYNPHQWRDAAEHFGYTYDEVANAVNEQSDGKKSLLEKLKELSQKLQI